MPSKRQYRQGLSAARLFMVLSAMSPLFALMAVRGSNLIPDRFFVTGCILLIAVPNIVLALRIGTALRLGERDSVSIGSVEDQRRHLFEYMFAVLFPLFGMPIDTWRDFVAMGVALLFIVFVFWRLNLHYMNVVFAVAGYSVYTVRSGSLENRLTDHDMWFVIAKNTPVPGESILAHRLSSTVYIETE